MALSFPSTPTAGQTYTDDTSTVWEFDGVKWNVVVGSSYRTFLGAKTSLDTAVLLTSTPTPLAYDVEDFDTGNIFNFEQADRYTIRKTGYYRLAGTYYTGPNGTGSSYTFTLRKNGVFIATTQISAANQAANYDASAFLNAGDYLEVLVSESSSTGSLLPGSYVEITFLGQSPNLSLNRSDAFSGVRVILSSNFSLSSSYTAASWSSAEFNVNADVIGNTYWDITAPTRIVIKVAGYYQLKSFLTTSSSGSENSYNLRLRKNGASNLTTAILNPNGTALLDEIYSLNANDYIELQANESSSTGAILAGGYLEVIRLGV